MAVYAVSDVQGCWRAESPDEEGAIKDGDELWLAGDLINRGPDSLKVLRKLRQLRADASS